MEEYFSIEEWNQFLKDIGDSSTHVNVLIDNQEKASITFQRIQEELQNELTNNFDFSLPTGFVIGKFEIVEVIGKGGMSSVYLAKRIDGLFDQEVAIKLLAPELLSQKHKSHFETERQILARLNHPNISKILDGGLIKGGIPYLIMEYVNGITLENYLDSNECTLNDRIDIFKRICEAVRHAHGQLILHRDLKPSNVILGEERSVKLLDFGIGGFIDESQIGYSEGGTIRYLPPEHFTLQEYSVRSDIYQLGLLGYRIFEGTDAFQDDDKEKTIDNIKLGNLAAWNRIASNRRLSAILSKCLQSKLEDRYDTVDALIIDLDFYKEDKPVKAAKANWRQDGLLFLKRNKIGAISALLLFILILGFSIWTSIQSNKIEREKEYALAINNFLTEIFKANNPNINLGEPISASNLLNNAEAKISQIPSDELRAAMNKKLGELYQYLGLHKESGALLEQALGFYNNDKTAHRITLSEIYSSLSTYYQGISKYQESDSLIDMAISTIDLDKDNALLRAEYVNDKAYINYLMGNFEKALILSDESISIFSNNLKSTKNDLSSQLSQIWSDHSRILLSIGNMDEALKSAETAVDISEQNLTDDLPVIFSALDALYKVHEKMGKYQKAIEVSEDILKKSTKVYGEQHIETLINTGNLAAVYYKLKEYSRADSLHLVSYQGLKNKLGPYHNLTVGSMYNLATSKYSQGDYVTAASFYEQVLEADIKNLGEEHVYVGSDYMSLGMVYKANMEYDKAENYYNRSLFIYSKSLNEDHYLIADIYRLLGQLYEEKKEASIALNWYKKSLRITEIVLPPDHPDHIKTMSAIQQLEKLVGT